MKKTNIDEKRKIIEVVRQYFDETYNKRNLSVGDAILSENCVFHGSPVAGIPAWKNYAAAWLNAFPEELKLTIEDIVVDNSKVAMRWTVETTHQGHFMGIAPTGRKLKWSGLGIFYITEGKITDVWGMNDIYCMMQQIRAI